VFGGFLFSAFRSRAALALAVIVGFSLRCEGSAPDWPVLTLDVMATLSRTSDVQGANDGSGRIFVLSLGGGISVIEKSVQSPFLNISNRVVFSEGERGLLGLAFAPDFRTSGQFYVHYSRRPDLATTVSRFKVRGDSKLADPESEQVVLAIPNKRDFHRGGQIAFGPDGFLYVAIGDGKPFPAMDSPASDPTSLMGKILRLDVSARKAGYSIPPSNPFVSQSGYRPEIWALGLRNPWRFSFDRLTGDLFIADVGEDRMEEVDFQAAGGPRGLWGWGGENTGSKQCNFGDGPAKIYYRLWRGDRGRR
jgi:glucose/arabinose dehydrogenase